MNLLQEKFSKAWGELNETYKKEIQSNPLNSKQIDAEFNESKTDLCIRYVSENSGVKVGDIIEDSHLNKIKVEKISSLFGAFDKFPIGRFVGKFVNDNDVVTKIPGVVYECDLINR